MATYISVESVNITNWILRWFKRKETIDNNYGSDYLHEQ
jgi:hypothetical protein